MACGNHWTLQALRDFHALRKVSKNWFCTIIALAWFLIQDSATRYQILHPTILRLPRPCLVLQASPRNGTLSVVRKFDFRRGQPESRFFRMRNFSRRGIEGLGMDLSVLVYFGFFVHLEPIYLTLQKRKRRFITFPLFSTQVEMCPKPDDPY
jgi:hypothetical protein